MSNTCPHEVTSVTATRTFVAGGREWIEQKSTCVDCGVVCETTIL